ncbi:MAG TPA: hypothetical protein VMF58_10330 [Rhizomicrobium sp.]|nr:hypothetical protein [Rhizomicrobium sp.]
MKRNTLAALCGAAVLVSGCASQKDVELDQKNLASVHRIAVVGPADPVAITVFTQRQAEAQQAMAAAAAIPFAGVLGAAIAGGVAGGISAEIAHETSEPMAKKVEEEHYKLGDAMQTALVASLKSGGFDATTVVLTREDPAKFPENYDSIKDQADLVLDATASAVCSNVGSGKTSHFRPVVTMNVHLVRASDHTIVMHKQFVLDDATAKPDNFHIVGESTYDLPDYDALKADVGKCLDGVKAAVPVLTQTVATTLSHAPQTVAQQ